MVYGPQGESYSLNSGKDVEKIISENAKQLANAGEGADAFREALDNLGLDTSIFTDTYLEQLREKVVNLADSTSAADEKLKLLAQLKVDELLGDSYD